MLGGVAVVGVWAARRHPLLLLACGAFLGLSFAGSNLAVPIETVFAERLYYAPSVGLALAVAWAADRWPATGAVHVAGIAFLAGIVLFSGSLYVMTLTGARWVSRSLRRLRSRSTRSTRC